MYVGMSIACRNMMQQCRRLTQGFACNILHINRSDIMAAGFQQTLLEGIDPLLMPRAGAPC